VRKSRFSEEPIIAVLKESETGVETGGAVPAPRDHAACFYRWKRKFGGLELSEAKRSRQLEEENRQLKYIVAEPAVDIRALKVGGSQKGGKPADAAGSQIALSSDLPSAQTVGNSP